MAVGSGGQILTSPDGVTWTPQSSGTTTTLRDITYGNGRYVAVGYNGVVLTSPDGLSWTECTSGTSVFLFGVAHGKGRFVAVGDDGTIITSEDGIEWAVKSMGEILNFYGVVGTEEGFLITGGEGILLSSPDGSSWTLDGSGTDNFLNAVARGGSQYVVVGMGGTILTSGEPPPPAPGISVEVDGVAIQFNDAQSFIQDGRTLVPVRVLAEQGFGYEVGWNGGTRTATIKGSTWDGRETVITLTAGAREAIVNGREVTLDVPASIVQNRTFVPLRFISEGFGCEVAWDPSRRAVLIRKTPVN